MSSPTPSADAYPRAEGWVPGPRGGHIRPWTKATAPPGRVQGSATIVQWCEVFIVEPKYGGPLGMLKIAKRARHGKTQAEQIAARRVLRARRMKWSRAGRPLAHDDLEGLLDRKHGKPTQQIQLEATVTTLAEAEGDLIAIFRADETLLPRILKRLTEQLPGLRPAILAELGEPAVLALPAPTSE